MSRLLEFLRLSGARRRSLVGAAAVVATTRLLLWVLPYRSLRGLLAKIARPRPATARVGREAAAEEIARDVALAARAVPGATCLVQALAGEWLLARAGLPATVRLGVARAGEGIEAHAWLESGGRVVLGQSERRYAELAPVSPLTGSGFPGRSPRP